MLQVLSIMSKVVFSPVWLLWRGYLLLWWAFGEENPGAASKPKFGAPVGGGRASSGDKGAAQDSAFEVVDSRAPAPKAERPTGPLMGGFVGSLLAFAVSGVISRAAIYEGGADPRVATLVWLWVTAAASLGSIFIVRRVDRKRRARGKSLFRATCDKVRGVGAACTLGAKMAAGGAKAAAEGLKNAAAGAGAGSPSPEQGASKMNGVGRAACGACASVWRVSKQAGARVKEAAPVVAQKVAAVVKDLRDPVKPAAPAPTGQA